MTKHYLILGVGDIGLPVANALAKDGHKVTAVSRSPKPELSPAITHILADARYLAANDLGNEAKTISHIAIIVSPSRQDGSRANAQAYQDSYWAISDNVVTLAKQLPNLQRLVFISSTSVYGQNSGESVTIDTPIEPPTSATAQILLNTERLLQQQFGEKCTIIRPSGIYGKKRLRLVTMARSLAMGELPMPLNGWTNRIVDTDLVAVIVNVLQSDSLLPVYLASDFAPVPMFEVLDFLATQQGLTLNLPNEPANTGKCIISNLPKNWLQYPNYQAGYTTVCLP